jgi:hypothetical protein
MPQSLLCPSVFNLQLPDFQYKMTGFFVSEQQVLDSGVSLCTLVVHSPCYCGFRQSASDIIDLIITSEFAEFFI